jgi:hypothetical protein
MSTKFSFGGMAEIFDMLPSFSRDTHLFLGFATSSESLLQEGRYTCSYSDDEVSQDSSSRVGSSADSEKEIPKFGALPPNVMAFLSYMYSID